MLLKERSFFNSCFSWVYHFYIYTSVNDFESLKNSVSEKGTILNQLCLHKTHLIDQISDFLKQL